MAVTTGEVVSGAASQINVADGVYDGFFEGQTNLDHERLGSWLSADDASID